jgi:hypothetical protein
MGKTLRWVIPGSRLLPPIELPSSKAAPPPGRWAYDQPVFLRSTKCLAAGDDIFVAREMIGTNVPIAMKTKSESFVDGAELLAVSFTV